MKNKPTLQPAKVGLGRMSVNRVPRLTQEGHGCAVFDWLPKAVTGSAGL